MNSRFFISILSIFIFSLAFALTEGTYDNINQPGMKLQLNHGKYKLWINYNGQLINIQEGTYKIQQGTIYFNPQKSNVGDLNPIQSEIIDECSFEMGKAGIFKAENCNPQKINKKVSHLKNFPKNWKLYKTKEFEIYMPAEAKVKLKDNKFTISYKNSYGNIRVSKNPQNLIQNLISQCKPEKSVNKKDTYFFICKNKTYLTVVLKEGNPSLVSYINARNFAHLKALSIAISSLNIYRQNANLKTKFIKWVPRDNSFSILVPEGWHVEGGTADLGVNGYLRIVQAYPNNKEVKFLGFYYPAYEYAQTNYGSQGVPPMRPEDYVQSLLFQHLAQQFKIYFENLKIEKLEVDEQVSQRITEKEIEFYRENGVNLNPQEKVFYGRGKYTQNGKHYELLIIGKINYITYPIGIGYTYNWGPTPVFLYSIEKGKINKWYPILKKMADSWKVNYQWLQKHYQKANIEAQQILNHYRKMSRIIHENEEYRLNLRIQTSQEISNTENEIFFDTFYALGGEERYDNPQTGEEIDVPTGADKYFYDNYSETWIRIKMDNPDALDIINELKNNGFIELKKHRY